MRNPGPRLLVAPLLGRAALGATVLGPAETIAATSTCDTGHWPAAVQGVPVTYKAGARAGDYLWHSSTGWHIRFTHVSSARLVFTGKIVANAPMSVSAVRLEKGDTFTLSADKKALTYRVAN